jgi:hypothetical protein
MMVLSCTSNLKTGHSSLSGEKSKIFERGLETIGKKKKVEKVDLSEDPIYVEVKKWNLDSNYSYNHFVKMSAESILEAMHIASASGSIEGMLNASIQWGELAAFVKNTEDNKIVFGFGSKEEQGE